MNKVNVQVWYFDLMNVAFCFQCRRPYEPGLCIHFPLRYPLLTGDVTLVGQGGCNLYQSPASTDIAKVVTCIDPRLTVLQPGEVQALYLPIVCPRPARIVRPFEFQHHLLDHGLLAAFDTQIGPDTLQEQSVEEMETIDWTPTTVEAGNALGYRSRAQHCQHQP